MAEVASLMARQITTSPTRTLKRDSTACRGLHELDGLPRICRTDCWLETENLQRSDE